MPAYRLRGLPQDDSTVRRILPRVEATASVRGSSPRGRYAHAARRGPDVPYGGGGVADVAEAGCGARV